MSYPHEGVVKFLQIHALLKTIDEFYTISKEPLVEDKVCFFIIGEKC